ncbi:MAG TPA: glycosyltransferase family 2 protein [Micropepsaceae bacterium]|jgi:dolichol-phosphate mannosyltransferase|nr:glycosyltransferase family 2 protein [Micropepsaceae bacterium]
MVDAQSAPFKISIVIPAYNEEDVIDETINGLAAAMDESGMAYELRVVDDGSKDSTWARLGALAQVHPSVHPIKNLGPGGFGMAVRAGLATFEGDAVIIVMADGSDSPHDILAYARALESGFDCAFGTRFSGTTAVTDYPPVKRLLNRMGNRLIAWVTHCRYDDFTNGFKGYRRWVVEAMQPLVSADFNLTVELSMKAVQTGAKYKIIPNEWKNRLGGVSKFHVSRLGPRYLLTIAYCLILKYLKEAGARHRTPQA